MISVIVPVYNVELYLRKCLDSVISQTYRNLEILVVDDGSTDGSSDICDEYAETDTRIKVYHTENKGVSAARNLGLDSANGDWIGFVDSDDWIEPDMYELLIKKATETGADVVECGYFTNYKNVTVKQEAIHSLISNIKAVDLLIRGEIKTQVWNKIWNRHLFTGIRFPNDCFFEDIAVTYKLIQNATVAGTSAFSYHYLQRKSGISHSYDIQNLADYWTAHKQRYEDLKESISDESLGLLLKFCAYAIARTWIWNIKVKCPMELLKEMSRFTRNNYPTFGFADWPLKLKSVIFLSRYPNKVSFFLAYMLNLLNRTLKPSYYK